MVRGHHPRFLCRVCWLPACGSQFLDCSLTAFTLSGFECGNLLLMRRGLIGALVAGVLLAGCSDFTDSVEQAVDEDVICPTVESTHDDIEREIRDLQQDLEEQKQENADIRAQGDLDFDESFELRLSEVFIPEEIEGLLLELAYVVTGDSSCFEPGYVAEAEIFIQKSKEQ